MLVSDNWIPLDSSYEAIVSRKLDAEHRHYVKPMRYDASASDVFPDFFIYWIHEVISRSRWKFSGCRHPAYLARKELKKAYYNREYGAYGWWHWDATEKTEYRELPHFPEARR
nr:DUF1173 family protein [Escherichia coli]UGK56337.1 hypothetical protein [Escherichia coli]